MNIPYSICVFVKWNIFGKQKLAAYGEFSGLQSICWSVNSDKSCSEYSFSCMWALPRATVDEDAHCTQEGVCLMLPACCTPDWNSLEIPGWRQALWAPPPHVSLLIRTSQPCATAYGTDSTACMSGVYSTSGLNRVHHWARSLWQCCFLLFLSQTEFSSTSALLSPCQKAHNFTWLIL